MKLNIFLSIALACFLVVIAGCAPQKPELLGCKPEVTQIAVTTPEAGWSVIRAQLSIANPNAYPVSVDGLTLKFDTGNGIQGYEEILQKFDIPAQGKISQQVSCNVTFMNIVSDLAMNKGLPGAKAAGYAAAIWKSVGGLKPMIIPQAAWDGLPPSDIVYTYETAIYTRAGGLQKWVKSTGTWPPAK